MKTSEAMLAAHREELLQRSAELRSRISGDAFAITNRFRVVDKATTFFRSGGGRVVVVGGVLVMLALGPRRMMRVAGRTALFWPMARRWLPRVLSMARGRSRA
jgi:hypothetical protein